MVFGENQDLIRTHFQKEADKVRAMKTNWGLFTRTRMIAQSDYDFIVTYQQAENEAERSTVLSVFKEKAVYAFVHLMSQISKDDYVRYTLTLIDDMLREDVTRTIIFEDVAVLLKRSPFSFFMGLLHRQDQYIVHITFSILTKMAVFGNIKLSGDELDYCMGSLKEAMNRGTNNDYIVTAVRCMQTLFRFDPYRVSFVNINGYDSLTHALYSTRKCGFQIQYQIIFCMWLLTFNGHAAEVALSGNLIQTISGILGNCQKEKVIRIVVSTLRNLITSNQDVYMKKQAALQMIQNRIPTKLDHLENRKFTDVDLVEDMVYLQTELKKVVQVLTSFDEYENELRQGSLHWSPAHKCEVFWNENAHRLNDNRQELLKLLVAMLEKSNDPLVLCVAAHDIGEFVRYYPRGKLKVEQLGGKEAMMRLLTVKDPNVRYHALLAAQKLMINNWKDLGLEI
ncbi:putative V-type proton ATPase subunit H 1 [Caenorhabditis elegans]|uniref:Probable V-type proton ATPase subunit H 1 n=1 Tax=Caenorhabditis elegans TaxID=6239 RepID=VATH1_CAEEL|nr:putative V-type proton ATPase subunit H 1 [Caenorhabditis elegans]Q20666.1 RecName: Full=Probable V-type proton ATPase subunit H 1; Short=V-ATPase subunit H 1; AltName: Full=Vacuolar proton pump subunit H 1 [Caenorhabditis elegans]CCD70812.1 Probable V-type proton ATPase subunit H 1 [Caenorhabditis elegans]|eukprot:NP_505171.1 Probable V-type proton ATPase subunit H 1 [Caenorhabditis elegans]